MEAAGVLGVATPILGSISNPPGGASWFLVRCDCHKDPISDQIPILLAGIKSQLLCGVRIKLAIGSHSYPG